MKERTCQECGSLFTPVCGNHKYCSYGCADASGKAHLVKPAGYIFHGTCARCGIAFESERKRKYHSDECMYQAQLEKQRASRFTPGLTCKRCGKALTGRHKAFCSPECHVKYYHVRKTDIAPLSDALIKIRIAERFTHIEHVSGHKSNGPIRVRCKACAGEFDINEQTTRKGRSAPCPHCLERERQEKAVQAERARLLGVVVALLQKRQKALTLKLIDAEQRTKVCTVCGTPFCSWHGLLTCSHECKKEQQKRAHRQNKHVRKAAKRANGPIDRDISLEKLIKRDKNTCHICGRKCDARDFRADAAGNFIVGGNHPSIDHVMPLAKGGTHTWGNVKLAHHKCNWVKSDAVLYERANGQLALAI